MPATIDDTYAEAFRSIYSEVLVTARDAHWLDIAARHATGNASSSILCDCEAGISRHIDASETPDGRPGVVLQFHVPRFWKEREQKLERSLLVRVSQNVLTCPTTACFNVLPAAEKWFPLGRKVAYFGDGHQFKDDRFGRRVRVIPILSGEFVIERRFGWADGLMGGNLWFFGRTPDAALEAAMKAADGARTVHGVRRRRVQRFEGRQQVQVQHRQHLRRVLPDAAHEAGHRLAASRGRRERAGDHHQRPRPEADRDGDASRDRRGPGCAGPADDLRRQLRRPAR
jgi:formylmethanofuran:tetrahydromethanopterin formyltransferase